MMGCQDQLSAYKLVPLVPGVYDVEVCIEAACAKGLLSIKELEVGHCEQLTGAIDASVCVGPPRPPELAPPALNRLVSVELEASDAKTGDTVRVTVTDAQDAPVIDADKTVSYEAHRPNGPDCEPVCSVAAIEL